jgi:hypothetical protein
MVSMERHTSHGHIHIWNERHPLTPSVDFFARFLSRPWGFKPF